MKFTAITMIAIARPGESQSHGISDNTVGDWASLRIFPQLGVGGRTPRPRKLSEASNRIAEATPNVPRTVSGASAFGNRCCRTMRDALAPTTRAATMNSS